MARSAAPNRKNKSAKSSRFGRWLLLWLVALGILGVATVCVTYGVWASTFDIETVKEMPSRSTVYDMDGKFYSRLGRENRIVVPLGKVSKNFIQALLAREDARFYQHRGVDPVGIIRAVLRNLISRSAVQGASTITQQLARNSYPDRISGQRKNAHRKLLEAFVALRIEEHYSKDQILENYVNRIFFGAGVYGVEAASLAYFGKHASDLSLPEAALLAGVIRGPGYYSPFRHLDRALGARDAVLERMVKLGNITQQQADSAKTARLSIAKKRPLGAQQNYAMSAIESDLDKLLTDDQRADGGLKIYTTIDPGLQKAAEEAVEADCRKIESRSGYTHPKRSDFSEQQRLDEAQTPYLQGAAVVIDNRSGAIRALVGGRDFSESNYNRALSGKRQIGSTFKPFVYAAALKKGMLPGMQIDDGPLGRGEIRGAGNWNPHNSDGKFNGMMRADEGLIQSRNTMSARVGQLAGLDDVTKMAAAAGVVDNATDIPRVPSVFIGTFGTDLEQLTSAYTVFPNNGTRKQAYVIERIDDAAGDVLYRAAHVEAPAMDPGVAWVMTGIMSKVLERGTAATARNLGWTRPAAGKTGTTNEYADAWFVGYTTSLTCGVWVGLDKPETIIPHGYGATLALPIWVDVMNAAPTQRYPTSAFKPPVPLEHVTICGISNQLATTGCDRADSTYSIDLPASLVPRDTCQVHRGTIMANTDRPTPPETAPKKSSQDGGIFRSFKRFLGGD